MAEVPKEEKFKNLHSKTIGAIATISVIIIAVCESGILN